MTCVRSPWPVMLNHPTNNSIAYMFHCRNHTVFQKLFFHSLSDIDQSFLKELELTQIVGAPNK